MSTVGIIGAGRLGQAMAQTALHAGRRVVMANSRGPGSLASLVSTLGEKASAGTVDEAAGADIVVIAVIRAGCGAVGGMSPAACTSA